MSPQLDSINVSLASQCMVFCQTLIGNGVSFNFALKADSFSFSMDTLDKNTMVSPNVMKKKITPSQRRRNERRRREFQNSRNLIVPSVSGKEEVVKYATGEVGDLKTTEEVTDGCREVSGFHLQCGRCRKNKKLGENGHFM